MLYAGDRDAIRRNVRKGSMESGFEVVWCVVVDVVVSMFIGSLV